IERGVIDRLTFWNNDETPMVKVKMVIENLGEPTTLVRAFDGDELDNSATASALLEAIHRQLSPTTASATGTTQAIATAGQFAGEQHASVTAPAASAGRHYRLEQNGAASRIVTTQDFPRTWREVGMAIANESLEVEDRDRSRGLYFVVDQVDSSDQGGLLKRMKFWGSDDPETVTRLVAVQPIDGGGNQILVFDEDEKLDGSAAATALLNRLSKHLH
ncbi:MAG: outer membrane protein assembly factor BamC, partial [Gammaproteobacteria bacterium]